MRTSYSFIHFYYHFDSTIVLVFKGDGLSNYLTKCLSSLHKWNEHKLTTIPNFRVSMTIVNTIDISCRQCKLNFEPLQSQVKSCHFLERRDVRRQYFYLSIQIFWNNWHKTTWIMIWIYYLLNRIRLDLDLNNSCWIWKIP